MIDIAASHRHRIGCSQIAQALGVSPFGLRHDLWAQLTGRQEQPDLSSELRVALGEPMEDVLRPFVAARLGRELRRDRREFLHPTLPIVAHVDYRVSRVAGELERPVLDMKTSLGFGARHRFGTDETDEVDESVLIQMQGYMLLTGASVAFVAALVPGPELKIFTVHADRELAAMIEDGVADFWRSVETDTPPDPQSEAEARQRWPLHAPGVCVEIDDQAAADLRTLATLKGGIAHLEKQEKALRDRLLPAFGDAETVIFQGHQLATFKANKASQRVDWQAVASELNPPAELIASHTRTQPGARVLRLSKELS